MTIYAIGDVQGCFDALQRLLEKIQFDPAKDILWFSGDLVNRGPQSLEVLRFIKALGDQHIVVLGNHDLHLLAVACGGQTRELDTLSKILEAEDKDELITWLRKRPLLHFDSKNNFVIVHAGLAPQWSIYKAAALANEASSVIQSELFSDFVKHMYGNKPDLWEDSLTGLPRWRCIINYLTRMRLCDEFGCLDFAFKGSLKNVPPKLMPWFEVPHRANTDVKIIFGHWAALGGHVSRPNVYALDTGCVWGNQLTALRLEDEVRICVPCPTSVALK